MTTTKSIYDTTITDKNKFTADIVDTKKYDKLSDSDKKIFLSIRNSILEIFPIESDNKFSQEARRYAENYAFIMMSSLRDTISNIVDTKIAELEANLKSYITTNSTTKTA